ASIRGGESGEQLGLPPNTFVASFGVSGGEDNDEPGSEPAGFGDDLLRSSVENRYDVEVAVDRLKIGVGGDTVDGISAGMHWHHLGAHSLTPLPDLMPRVCGLATRV